MEAQDNKTQPPLSPGSPTTPEMQKAETEAKKFLEQLLHTSAWAKHRVSLYPEQHPLVQELLMQLHRLIAEALKDRTDLMLEFQPGRIIVDKKHVFGNRENIARFSQEMYLRRVARLTFDNSLDLSSLFKFLKFINTEVDTLHKQAETSGKFFPEFRGIHLEEVDYKVLAKIKGESLDTEYPEEGNKNILEILFGKKVVSRYRGMAGGAAIGQYIPLTDKVMEFLKDYIQKAKSLPVPDPNLPPGIQVSRAFRNILDAIEVQNPPNAAGLKRDLAESFLQMPLEIRSELLIEEIQEGGGGGDLVPLLKNLPEGELREFFDSLTNQFKAEEFPELALEIDALSKTLFESGEICVLRKKGDHAPPCVVLGEEYIASLRNNLSSPFVKEHFHKILYEIFQKSERMDTIEHCLEYLVRDLKERLGERQWKNAESLLKTILETMRKKQFFGTDFYHTEIEKLEKNVFEILNPLLAEGMDKDDLEIIENMSGTFLLFNLTPEQVLLKLLTQMEDRSLRKKILLYVLDSEELPQDTLSEMLNHEEWYVVRNAVTLIREKADPRFLPLLEKTLSHPQPPVQKETLLALGSIRHKKALGLLIGVFQNYERPMEIRTLALDCMSGFQDPAPREIYLELLKDQRNPWYDFDLRITGIKQLGTYNDGEIIHLLVSFIQKFHLFHRKKWLELKKSAAVALERMNTPEANAALAQVKRTLLRK